jgi:uncharacterized membrane protein YkoI
MARNFLLSLASALLIAPSALAAEATTPHAVCLSSSETREEIAAHRLLEPFAALKSAAGIAKSEALSAKLCRLGEEFVYEIALLDHRGRLAHLVINAATGKLISSHNLHEASPRT